MRSLGMDVGGSATRWHLAGNGDEPALSGVEAGFSGHLFRPEMIAQAAKTINAIAQRTGPVDAMVVGVTGLSIATPESRALHELLGKAFDTDRIAVMSDIELCCRTCFAPGEGTVVYAGTGSIAAHVTAGGELVTAGGKGVLIDDAGGGYWIAIRALRAILRAEDTVQGSGWRTMLGQAMADALGGQDWPTVRQAVYGRDRGAIGMLAVPVGKAASSGDAVALSILSAAGTELATLAGMLEGRVGRRRIALSGGAAGLHPAILLAMQKDRPDTAITLEKPDVAAAAARLARSASFFAGQASA